MKDNRRKAIRVILLITQLEAAATAKDVEQNQFQHVCPAGGYRESGGAGWGGGSAGVQTIMTIAY